jgi:hypothetical protein
MTITTSLDIDALADGPRIEPGTFVARELDAERVIAAWQYTTRDTLATMRHDTPRLRTLTVIDVLFDIVTALRCKHRSE